ncbi:hypothetical protein BZM27_11155 [Paraburkholderia steynii]|uniref:Uncharacterized protein n=1 Tax=Paraburkholderia steynii TaxID=1245441 RepID=A0A4R0XDU1_9BURK|nr:hypothetical protein BZM27_11155 [Paraburkholderia steynii]
MKVNFERLVWTHSIPADPVVWVSVNAIDASWQHDKGLYVGPGGKGGTDNRYAFFGEWLAANLHRPVQVPEIGLSRGEVVFQTGGTDSHGFAIADSRYCPLRLTRQSSSPFERASQRRDELADCVEHSPAPYHRQLTSTTLIRSERKFNA